MKYLIASSIECAQLFVESYHQYCITHAGGSRQHTMHTLQSSSWGLLIYIPFIGGRMK